MWCLRSSILDPQSSILLTRLRDDIHYSRFAFLNDCDGLIQCWTELIRLRDRAEAVHA